VIDDRGEPLPVLQAAGIGRHLDDLGRIGIERPVKEVDAEGRGPHHHRVLHFGDLLPRTDEEVRGALALVGTSHAEVHEEALPVVVGRARDETGGHFPHHRTGGGEIHCRSDVRRDYVRSEHGAEASVSLHNEEVAVAHPGGELSPASLLGGADHWNRPQVELARALEIQLVIEPRHGLPRRHAQLEIELADPGVSDFGAD
jgi:hypothetical protein